MTHLNVEIKARCSHSAQCRQILLSLGADYRGLDEQIDTYFHCSHGRLKLREGTIERQLIFYQRPDNAGPKESQVALFAVAADSAALRHLLAEALGVRLTVKKRREIYFIQNVKFHLDVVEPLGSFVEIEAIDQDGTLGREALYRQCRHYIKVLKIDPGDFIEQSYSDLFGPAR